MGLPSVNAACRDAVTSDTLRWRHTSARVELHCTTAPDLCKHAGADLPMRGKQGRFRILAGDSSFVPSFFVCVTVPMYDV